MDTHEGHVPLCILTVLVTRNFTKSADRPRRKSAFFRGIGEDIRRIVKGCPRNREWVSAESSKGVRGFVEGHQHSHNRQRHPRNRTVFQE